MERFTGRCTIEGQVLIFVATEKLRRSNQKEIKEASDFKIRFLVDADGNLQELVGGSDEVKEYKFHNGSFKSLLQKL